MRALFKTCLSLKSYPSNFFSQFYFSKYNCPYILYLWAKFLRKIPSGNGLPIFGGKVDVPKSQMVYWPPFWNPTSDFKFFCCIWVLLEYFTSDPHFNTKFVLKSMFLMLSPYGPPLLTTNGQTEDLDHLSVKVALIAYYGM